MPESWRVARHAQEVRWTEAASQSRGRVPKSSPLAHALQPANGALVLLIDALRECC